MPSRLALIALLPLIASVPAQADPVREPATSERLLRAQQRTILDALPDARRGDDPAGPPADERLNRTTRKVGGNSVRVRVLKLPLDR